jgi:hypothetical protein
MRRWVILSMETSSRKPMHNATGVVLLSLSSFLAAAIGKLVLSKALDANCNVFFLGAQEDEFQDILKRPSYELSQDGTIAQDYLKLTDTFLREVYVQPLPE